MGRQVTINERVERSRREAVRRYHEALTGAQPGTGAGRAYQYLIDRYGREWADDMIEAGTLGYVDVPAPGDEHARGRLCIPYVTTSGNIHALKFRCIQQHDCKEAKHGKYINRSGLGSHMYLPQSTIGKHDTVAICEGELDALACTVVVGIPAIGIPGVNSFNERTGRIWPLILADFTEVLIMGDADDKGQGAEFAEMLSIKYLDNRARTVMMPDGHDLSSYLTAPDGGVDAILSLAFPPDLMDNRAYAEVA